MTGVLGVKGIVASLRSWKCRQPDALYLSGWSELQASRQGTCPGLQVQEGDEGV